MAGGCAALGLRSALVRSAGRSPVPVFAVAGAGAREAVQDLRLHPEFLLTQTPRAANVLLLAGGASPELENAARAAHDAMSHPRVTVRWDTPSSSGPGWSLPAALSVPADADIVQQVGALHVRVLDGSHPTEAALLVDEEPAPWRGVGPYGQGGTGMTGGVPYGRPMPERADDRDGLTLDQVPLRIGPLFSSFPPGFSLSVKLQGDLVQEAIPDVATDLPSPAEPGPFVRALHMPVPVAELELERARALLRWAAEGLRVHGLSALGMRVLRLAGRIGPGDAAEVVSVERTLRRTRLFGWATGSVAPLGTDLLRGMGIGPVGRAAGLAEDLRLEETAYLELGFAPVLHEGADSAARWRQRLGEAAQALSLAAAAGERTAFGEGRVESPHGRLERGEAPAHRLLPLLPALLQGLDWGDAVIAVVSLDLDLDEAGAVRTARVGTST